MFARTNGAIAWKLSGLYVSNLVGDRVPSVGLLALTGPLLLVGVIRNSSTAACRRGRTLLHQLLRALLLQLVGLHRRLGLTWREASHPSDLRKASQKLDGISKTWIISRFIPERSKLFFLLQDAFLLPADSSHEFIFVRLYVNHCCTISQWLECRTFAKVIDSTTVEISTAK